MSQNFDFKLENGFLGADRALNLYFEYFARS